MSKQLVVATGRRLLVALVTSTVCLGAAAAPALAATHVSAKVEVPGVATSVQVASGEAIEVVGKGKASYCPGCTTEPDGSPANHYDGSSLLAGAPVGELLADVVGPSTSTGWFAVGTGDDFTATLSGELRLIYNDVPGAYYNNGGGYSVSIARNPPLLITTASLPTGVAGQPYTATLQGVGGEPPYKWALAKATKLPKGLKFEKSGAISGTPKVSGDFSLEIELKDSLGLITRRTFTLSISGPLVTSVAPATAPIEGGASLTVTGRGFTPTSVITLTPQEPTQVEAGVAPVELATTYVSSTELTATTVPLRDAYAGPLLVSVTDPASSPLPSKPPVELTLYVPEIGKLIFRQPYGAAKGEPYGECSATVVASGNESVILTAGHCIREYNEKTKHYEIHEEFVFAPGWVGPLCPGTIQHAEEFFTSCPTINKPPLGVWEAYFDTASYEWGAHEAHAFDYGLIDVYPQANTLQREVGGAIPISFRSEGADPGSFGGSPLVWDSVSASLHHCIEEGHADGVDGSPPDNLEMECGMESGNSGGPWLLESGAETEVGAVNSTSQCSGQVNKIPRCNKDKWPEAGLTGTYMGDQAEQDFQAVEQLSP